MDLRSAFTSPVTLWIALGGWFLGTIGLAAAFFPRRYDWQHVVISSLASPRDNPYAYGIGCLGLAGTGLLLIPFASFLRERLAPFAPRITHAASGLFLLGAISLVLTAIVVPGHYRLLGFGRSHEHLAQISSVAFCLSLPLYFAAVRTLPSKFSKLRLAVALVAILPLTAFVANRVALLLTYAFFSPDAYRAAKAYYWSSLALWEWTAILSIYLFLGIMIFNLQPMRDLDDRPNK
jgi:hypothetical protein